MRYEYQGDDRVLEQVGEEWCKCLDQNTLSEKFEQLVNFFSFCQIFRRILMY